MTGTVVPNAQTQTKYNHAGTPQHDLCMHVVSPCAWGVWFCVVWFWFGSSGVLHSHHDDSRYGEGSLGRFDMVEVEVESSSGRSRRPGMVLSKYDPRSPPITTPRRGAGAFQPSAMMVEDVFEKLETVYAVTK